MDDNTKDNANILVAGAKAAASENRLPEAERLYREALTALEKTFGRNDRRLVIVLQPLLEVVELQGQEAATVGIKEYLKRLGQ